MRKLNSGKQNSTQMVSEYGQKRLIRYADSFSELAGLIACGKEQAFEKDMSKQTGDRQFILLRNEQYRNREMLSGQLKEMARIMQSVAKESYNRIPFPERRFKLVYKSLKQIGVEMKDLIRFENEDGHTEIGLVARSRRKKCISLEDTAGLMSVALNKRLLAEREGASFIGQEYDMYCFYEEPTYQVMTGSARAVKETEKISGDNFSFYETAKGHQITLLSDGTGSGMSASDDSDQVIDLVQKLMEAGFSKEKAVQILNSSINVQGEEQNMPTLDICDLNLYTGGLELLKIGAACTYIKREHMIDRISGGSLPLGADSTIMPQTVKRDLSDGDYVIMVSDGIIDAVNCGMGEDMLSEFLGSISCQNPTEIAGQILNYCIHECKGQIRDDMTVLVIGLWENTM